MYYLPTPMLSMSGDPLQVTEGYPWDKAIVT